MPDALTPPDAAGETLADLLQRLREAREQALLDPFGDPVLLIALAVSRRLDDGRLDAPAIGKLIGRIADDAASERAGRIAAYLGLPDGDAIQALEALAARLVRPDPDDSPVPFAAYREAVERPRFAAVFTAHPTFSLPPATGAALAAAASGAAMPKGLSHRPAAPTLTEEFVQAAAAIARGRDALDALAAALFETAEALERGHRVVEEALRSPHYREYLRAQGRLCLQFGYSDSGRYVGQLPASYLAERLKLRLAEQLRRHGLADIELVLFDTHGESIGRGAHPESLADRLAYLSPPAARAALTKVGLKLREESSFQGGDGYLLFGTPVLAAATIARIAEHAFAPVVEDADPIYAESDWAADFFATVRREMQLLVEDPGYAALLGAFGPGLLDRTGSRPAARQSDMGGPSRISHPSQLRAIPNNAILHQMGWLANTLHGLGAAAAANPDAFADLRTRSPRFARALAMAARAAASSDIGVLRATVDTLDPGPWLDRAGATQRPGRREELMAVAEALEKLDLSAATRRMFRRLQADNLALRAAWPELPRMPDRLVLLHALRLALIHRIWLLAVALPEFSPRHGATREALVRGILQLDVDRALALLAEVFPAKPDPSSGLDFHEPSAPRSGGSYAAEHATLFHPMGALFALVRECSAAIVHEVGAFG